jgi:hypothetical protein
MDADGLTIDSSPGDGSTQHPPPGNAFTTDPTPRDHGPRNDVGADPSMYSQEQEAYILSIAQEAAKIFPAGKVYNSIKELRKETGEFGQKKGFAVTTVGSRLLCTRCPEPTAQKNRRLNASSLVPLDKQRNTSSNRCGCPFKISFSPVHWNDKSSESIKITSSSFYTHDQRCFPCSSQLALAKQKSGALTRAVNESKIKTILAVLKTNQKIPVTLMRELVRPMFPPDHPLCAQFLRNFSKKARRILKRTCGEVEHVTVTNDDEALLTNNFPEYLSESFQLFDQLVKEAEMEPTDIQQIEAYLAS